MKGSIAEAKFVAVSTEKGFTVSWPLQPSIYDVILDNNNRLFKVQIKSTVFLKKEKHRSFYQLSLLHKKSKKIKYHSSNIDVIAILIANCHWYIIPIEKIKHKKYLKFRLDSGKMFTSQYLENWDFFVGKNTVYQKEKKNGKASLHASS